MQLIILYKATGVHKLLQERPGPPVVTTPFQTPPNSDINKTDLMQFIDQVMLYSIDMQNSANLTSAIDVAYHISQIS